MNDFIRNETFDDDFICSKISSSILMITTDVYITSPSLNLTLFFCGAVVELSQHHSCDLKVPSSIPRSGISVEVTSQC